MQSVFGQQSERVHVKIRFDHDAQRPLRLHKSFSPLFRSFPAGHAFLRKKRGIPVGEDLQRRLETLTAREATVLQYMREGLNTRGIAERLGISERTVYEYRTVIYQKLGTKDVDSLP